MADNPPSLSGPTRLTIRHRISHKTQHGTTAHFASEDGETWYAVAEDAPWIQPDGQIPWTREGWRRL